MSTDHLSDESPLSSNHLTLNTSRGGEQGINRYYSGLFRLRFIQNCLREHYPDPQTAPREVQELLGASYFSLEQYLRADQENAVPPSTRDNALASDEMH